VGRNTKYDPDTFPTLAEGYLRHGHTIAEICEKLDISTDSFYEYVKRYPVFADAVKRGQAPIDFEVESEFINTLCRTHQVTERKVIRYTTPQEIGKARKLAKDKGIDFEINDIVIRVEETQKIIEPDPGSVRFYLQNLMRRRYPNSGNKSIELPDPNPGEKLKLTVEFIDTSTGDIDRDETPDRE
jgi:transposase-like protein